MSEIEWTDETWQVLSGCTPVSPGCRHCYSARLAATRLKNHPRTQGLARVNTEGRPVFTGEVRLHEDQLEIPGRWRRHRKIFVADRGDLFHPDVPIPFLDAVFAAMAAARWHTFQLLTKRPERMRAYLVGLPRRRAEFDCDAGLDVAPWPMPNVLLGCSVEDQRWADGRMDPMTEIAARGWRTFVSYEPALGAVDWVGWEFLSWLISGGESGPSARPSHPDWHRATRDWCARHGVPYLFKQWGAWAPQMGAIDLPEFGEASRYLWAAWDGREWDYWSRPSWCDDIGDPDDCVVHVGKKVAGRLLDGVIHDAFPGNHVEVGGP